MITGGSDFLWVAPLFEFVKLAILPPQFLEFLCEGLGELEPCFGGLKLGHVFTHFILTRSDWNLENNFALY